MVSTAAGETGVALKGAADDATVAKARAELRKLEAEADNAETAARVAALKAAIGEVPPSGFTGAVTASPSYS